MARVIVPNTDVLLRQVAGPQQVGFVQREQPLGRIARIAGIFDKLVQSPAAVGALSAGREIVTGGEDAKRLEAMRRLGMPVGGKDVAAATSAVATPAPVIAPAPAPVTVPAPTPVTTPAEPVAEMSREAFVTRGKKVLDPGNLFAGLATAAEKVKTMGAKKETAPATPVAKVETTVTETEVPTTEMAAPPVDKRMIGPKEMVDQRIIELQRKGDRSAYENFELQILQAQRVGETQAPLTATPPRSATKTPIAEVETEDFVATTPEGIYAEARLADTPEKQASVLEKAATVFRVQPGRPQNIFEALGFGRPAGADEEQLKLVAGLFPRVVSPTEKSIADAELARARAEQLRAQAGLTGEKTESERLMRGAKQETELAKAFDLRARSYINLLKLQKQRGGGRGGRKRSAGEGAALKDATASTKYVETMVKGQVSALENDNDLDSRIAAPGGSRPSDPRRPTGETARKIYAAQADWDEQLKKYETAQARIAERQKRIDDLNAQVAEGRETLRALTVPEEGETVPQRLEKARKFVGGRKGAPAPVPVPAPTPAPVPVTSTPTIAPKPKTGTPIREF